MSSIISARSALLLASLATFAIACSSSSPSDDLGTEQSDIRAGKSPDEGPAPCPLLSPPAPGFCTNGALTPRTNANGCTIGYDCVVPPPTTSCTDLGGTCVGISPSSCAGGRWADATMVSCGGGVGAGCCLPECPVLSPPGPGFCPNGTVVPRKNAAGCDVGFDCVVPPSPKTSCADIGGTCVGLSPSSCPSNRWADATTVSCGGSIGAGCCLPECPALAAPGPGFCPNGTIVPRKNAAGCDVGFDCIQQ